MFLIKIYTLDVSWASQPMGCLLLTVCVCVCVCVTRIWFSSFSDCVLKYDVGDNE